MYNFSINFSYPWLLLLLIPAVAFTLIPYFRLSKKYRKTRNRITSIVLHMIIMVLSILILSGLTFTYQLPNTENEILLLVDVSDTEEESQQTRDEFIQTVLSDSQYGHYNIGVVTFGFDQQYAVPLTDNIDEIYSTYMVAPLPDTTATNIAAALRYAQGLFNNPETAKIVLITDAKETDEEAVTAIRTVASQGIKVDTVYISSAYEGSDVQISSIELPDYHLDVDEECTITVSLQSTGTESVLIELQDEAAVNVYTSQQMVNVSQGTNTVSFTHTFEEDGLHKLLFKISVNGDSLEKNNEYYSYFYLEDYNDILILERMAGESDALVEMLEASEEEDYVITVKQIAAEDVPTTVDGLRAYDQVILNNIAHADMLDGFEDALESYVSDYGGGVFTVGGNDDTGEANAYDHDDMVGTTYQRILPVTAVEYTPPVGVMVIIDRSGSMGGDVDSGRNKLEWAKGGAYACLAALSERDYIGIMTLESDYATILPLTPRSQEPLIRDAISSIKETAGGTEFAGAIMRAGEALINLKDVAKRHIIIVSDCVVNTEEKTKALPYLEGYYATNGITLSIVGVNVSDGSEEETTARELIAAAGDEGELYMVSEPESLMSTMREDLNAPFIKDVNMEEFHPFIYNEMSPLVEGMEIAEGENNKKLAVTLDGFYGVKMKAGADLILVGDYNVPIYAQWKYGKGMVGSFMCDLNGNWSSNFMADASGQLFINNVINNLMPTQDITPKQITVDLEEDNYTNQLSVYAGLGEGDYVTGEVIDLSTGEEISLSLNSTEGGNDLWYVTTALTAENNYSRCNFVIKTSGVYKFVIKKYNAEGVELAKIEFYKSMAYSEEYDAYVEETNTDFIEFMSNLAERGNGTPVEELENPWEIFEGFVTAIDRMYDPRFLFMILAIVLFLLDIAVRKFKFKWPHELIREYKNKKNSK